MQRNKLLTSKNLILSIALFLFFNTNMVLGGTVKIETIADGAVNPPQVDTDSDSTSLYRSFISWKSIFEFDLSPIPENIMLTDATLSLTYTKFFAADNWLPITINFYAYAGDGEVTVSDFSSDASLVGSITYSEDENDGTALDLSLTDLGFIQSLLYDENNEYLTFRVWCENDLFVGGISSLENTTYDPVSLTLEYSTVPLPSALIFIASGIVVLAGITRRKKY